MTFKLTGTKFRMSGDFAISSDSVISLSTDTSLAAYGARGDGVTDDATAIQAAINAASAAGTTLDGGGKTYRVGSHINLRGGYTLANATFYLPTTISLSGAATIGGVARAMYAQNTSGLTLEGCTFYSDGASSTKAVSIALETVSGVAIRDCTFHSFGNGSHYAQGIIAFACDNVAIERSVFRDCSGDGAALSDGCDGFRVVGCRFHDNADWGFVASNNCTRGYVAGNDFFDNDSTGTGADECSDVMFVGNRSNGNEHGIRIARFGGTTDAQQNISIVGNVCRGNGQGIAIESCTAPGSVAVVGNVVRTSTTHGIAVVDSTGFTISGNYIGTSGNHGVLLISYAVGTPVGTGTITGNTVDGCEYGIRQLSSSGALTDVTATGNRVLNASVAAFSGLQGGCLNDFANDMRATKALGVVSALTSATASAGAIASPGNFAGFIDFYVDGTKYKVPYFAA